MRLSNANSNARSLPAVVVVCFALSAATLPQSSRRACPPTITRRQAPPSPKMAAVGLLHQRHLAQCRSLQRRGSVAGGRTRRGSVACVARDRRDAPGSVDFEVPDAVAAAASWQLRFSPLFPPNPSGATGRRGHTSHSASRSPARSGRSGCVWQLRRRGCTASSRWSNQVWAPCVNAGAWKYRRVPPTPLLLPASGSRSRRALAPRRGRVGPAEPRGAWGQPRLPMRLGPHLRRSTEAGLMRISNLAQQIDCGLEERLG